MRKRKKIPYAIPPDRIKKAAKILGCSFKQLENALFRFAEASQ